MDKTLKKVIEFAKCISNNKSANHIKLTNEEHEMLKDLNYEFSYLVCHRKYSEDDNTKVADKIIKQNKILQGVFYEGTERYDDIMQDEVELRQALENGNYYISKEGLIEDEHKFLANYEYEKVGKFLYQYIKIKPNNKINIQSKRKVTQLSIKPIELINPLMITGEEREEIINSVTPINGNIYQLSAYRFKDIIPTGGLIIKDKSLFNNYLKNEGMDYIDVDGVLVSLDKYLDGGYATYAKMEKYQSGFLVVNKDGDVLDTDTQKSMDILNNIRVLIARNGRRFNYYLEEEQGKIYNGKRHWGKGYRGKVFVVSDKYALMIPKLLIRTLPHINSLNYNVTDKSLSYFYTPKRQDRLSTREECEQFLKECREIRVKGESVSHKLELDAIMTDAINKSYNEDNLDLQQFLEKKILAEFPNATISILPLQNIGLLLNKLVDNEHFLNDEENTFEIQRECVRFMIDDFYGFSITSKKVMKQNGKLDYVEINPDTLYLIFDNNLLPYLNPNEKHTPMLALHRDETYIALCAFLIYTNLIYNNFKEDINPKKSTLSNVDKISLDEKIKQLNMDKFRMERKGFPATHPREIKEKKDVIASIRNSVAHFSDHSLKVKFSQSGKPEDIILRFGKDGNDFIWNEISCGDFLEFITNPLFAKYREYDYNLIKVKSFEELMEQVTSKI